MPGNGDKRLHVRLLAAGLGSAVAAFMAYLGFHGHVLMGVRSGPLQFDAAHLAKSLLLELAFGGMVPLGLAGVVAIAYEARAMGRRARAAGGLCVCCAYPCTGLAVCPECGADPGRPALGRARPWVVAILCGWLLGQLGGAGSAEVLIQKEEQGFRRAIGVNLPTRGVWQSRRWGGGELMFSPEHGFWGTDD
jgi:hypothetical protein